MLQYLKIDNKTISKPLIEIVKQIRLNINNGKLKELSISGDNIKVTCPFHKEGKENKASAYIFIGNSEDQKVEYGWFRCFTCNEEGPFYHFVAACFDKSDDWAKEWLLENFSDGLIEESLTLPLIDIDKKKVNNYINDSILNQFENFHPYMNKRKLNEKVRQTFEVKYDPKTKCLLFPVRDEKGNLVMFTRRSVLDKTFIIDKDKEKPLYLLYYILQKNINKVLICEGQIDALTAWGYGFPACASMGSLSEHQIELLNNSNINVLYTMFDNDSAGKKFTRILNSKIRKDIFIINVPIIYKNKKDINDLTDDEFWNCIESAEKSF